MTTVAPAVGRLDDEAEDQPTKTIRPRRPWPGTRAAVGGLLVALSALGLFLAFQQANEPPQTLYVVARESIPPGTVLGPEHLGAQRMDLPGSVASVAFTASQDDLVLGTVTVAAIGAGELVQRSDVRDSGSADAQPNAFEMSFRVDSARAVDGTLKPGERVDILATVGTGPNAPTDMVQQSVLVTDVTRASDSSLAGERQVITVALDDTADVVALTAAADKGDLTLVRSRVAQ